MHSKLGVSSIELIPHHGPSCMSDAQKPQLICCTIAKIRLSSIGRFSGLVNLRRATKRKPFCGPKIPDHSQLDRGEFDASWYQRLGCKHSFTWSRGRPPSWHWQGQRSKNQRPRLLLPIMTFQENFPFLYKVCRMVPTPRR